MTFLLNLYVENDDTLLSVSTAIGTSVDCDKCESYKVHILSKHEGGIVHPIQAREVV